MSNNSFKQGQNDQSQNRPRPASSIPNAVERTSYLAGVAAEQKRQQDKKKKYPLPPCRPQCPLRAVREGQIPSPLICSA